MTTLFVLDYNSGDLHVLPYERKTMEEAEEDLTDAGFLLDEISWMISEGRIIPGWPR